MKSYLSKHPRAGIGTKTDRQEVLFSETGATKDGVPLALNRAAAPDLQPWISRMMVAMVYGPDDVTTVGLLCNDAGYVRTAVGADWVAGTADGPLEIRDESFLCGQHSKAMPLTYRGGVKVAGFMLRPGAIHALWGVEDGTLIDRIKPMEFVGIEGVHLTKLYNLDLEPEDWLLAIENWLRNYIATNNPSKPEPLSQRFEQIAFADPNRSLEDFAREQAVSMRTLQRLVKRDFGLTPKQVMRRARTLDFAARLCGVADEEEEDILLRFFDQSHQIREFTAYFGMTPQHFRAERQGLLTLSLEIRQARRLELLERISPGSVRPWMREPFQREFNRTAS